MFELASTAEFVTLSTHFSDWTIVVAAGPVPTASQWGLIVMSGLLLIAGIDISWGDDGDTHTIDNRWALTTRYS